MMLSVDSKKIYSSKGYYLKRLKVLEKHGYIKREDYFYIKLDTKGKELVRKMGYDYKENCRNKEYKERLKNIAKIASITINTNIDFIPSWDVKCKDIYTETSRRYIGEIIYKNKKSLVYYINRKRDWMYERQIIGDIKKSIYYNDFIVFIDNINRVNKKNYYFILGKDNICFVGDSKDNLEKLERITNIDYYQKLSEIYSSELLLSNWIEADYMKNDRYIITMPFLNTEKLHRINIFLKSNKNINKRIDIFTLKENKNKVKEILRKECNIIEIDKLLEERMNRIKLKGKIPLFFLVSYIVLIPIICWYYNMLNSSMNFTKNNIKAETLLDTWLNALTNIYILAIWLIVSVLIIVIYKMVKTTIKNSKIETIGVKYKNKDGTFGTADWANKEEIEEFLSIGKRDGIIIGETDEHELITLPLTTKSNKNIAILGSSGCGKTAGFVLPNAIELAQGKEGKNISMVFTDPKGELYRQLAKYLESKGYDVKVFNLVNPVFSNGCKFTNFIEDETDAQIFSQTVIENTQLDRKSTGDEFWNRGEQNLLKALLLYVINYVEKDEEKNLGYIYDKLASGNIKEIDKLFDDTEGSTRLAYNIYAQATDIVKQSIVTGLATRLQIFQTDSIRNLTNKDEINFEIIGKKKTCIFVITSDTNSTFDFLATLFFSFLFIKLIKLADSMPDGKLPIETVLILDEFTNIGRIKDLEKKISTTRSRLIDIWLIFQSIAQLENRYENNAGQEILR